MDDPLTLLVISVRVPEAFKPFLGDLLEELRHALLLGAGGLLQLALQAWRKTPAIDLSLLHVRHCSAGRAPNPSLRPPRYDVLGYAKIVASAAFCVAL
jgi:hypothetical protein